MKITEIRVQRFGIWRDASFPVGRAGLNVFYGPNETGKSTLLRFLRGVLYGFPENSAIPQPASGIGGDAGALRLEHDGRAWELRREPAPESNGPNHPRGAASVFRLDAEGPVATPDADRWLEQTLCGVPEDVYQRVFAVGLEELQELATLQGEEVAHRIYGTSLGPEGRRLLGAFDRCRARQEELLLATDERSLPRLLERDESARRDLAALGALRDRHDALTLERQELEERIESRKALQAANERELRGLQLMARSWEPWRQVDALRRELRTLPQVKSFPENGVERLQTIESECESLRKARSRVREEAKALRRQAGGRSRDESVDESRRALWSLLDRRDDYQSAVTRATEGDAAETAARRDLDARLAALGGEWSPQRLGGLDLSAEKQHQLVTRARQYQQALARRNRMRRRLKGWSRSCRAKSAEIADRLKELNAARLDDALGEARQRLADAEEFARLQRELKEHDGRRQELRAHAGRLTAGLTYPHWLPMLLWFFTLGGIAAAALGFYQGLHQNGVAGMMWALLGATCGGLAFAVRSHYDAAVSETHEHWSRQLHESENRARQSEQELDRLQRRSPGLSERLAAFDAPRGTSRAPRPGVDTDPADAHLAETRSRLAELERLAELNRKVTARRAKLAALRTKFQQAHREVTSARQEWCSLLRGMGLADATRVKDVFDAWKNIATAHQSWRAWQSASDAARDSHNRVAGFEQRTGEVARQLGERADAGSPATLSRLAAWEQRLSGFDSQRDETTRLLAEARKKRCEAAECTRRLKTLRAQRRALLREARCRSRPQFERKANARIRRGELEELLEIAQSDLSKAAAGETELAIVDDDFRSYDPQKAKARAAACQTEADAAERELESLHQRLGAVSQELATLEADDREIALRAAQADVHRQLAGRSEEWIALCLARRVLDHVRTRFERDCQPATLIAASTWLARLTGGRYRTVWTPLGSRELRVEDERGESFSVERLSTGAREQLFLAVRLALIRDFQHKGVELPIVLDDILVNFDQQRTEAALQTLIEFADEGQQVLLFTCHRHLAQLAEERHIEAIRLPTRDAPTEPAREERRAG